MPLQKIIRFKCCFLLLAWREIFIERSFSRRMFWLPILLVLVFVQFIFVIFGSLTLIQLATVEFLSAYFPSASLGCFLFLLAFSMELQDSSSFTYDNISCSLSLLFLFSFHFVLVRKFAWKNEKLLSLWVEFYSCSHEAKILFWICWLILWDEGFRNLRYYCKVVSERKKHF